MRDLIIGLGAMLGMGSAQASPPDVARAPQEWRLYQLKDGAALLYLPLAVTLDDYPKAARRAGDEGTSTLNLQVDTSGLKACSTARSSGSPVLDEQACRLYRERGRFELRGTSQPVTVQAPVRWVLMD
jgi:TonB family protein